MRKGNGRRLALRTVLLVGEGDAEAAFIAHLRLVYPSRGFGWSIKVKKARGMGALGVVNFAIRQSQNFDYDLKVALLDADVCWDEKTQSIARKNKVQVILCDPCLEAMLLSLHGDVQQGRSTYHHKQTFLRKFGKAANDTGVYTKHFSKEILDNARVNSSELESLLAILTASNKFSP